jgi:hypothetical protein
MRSSTRRDAADKPASRAVSPRRGARGDRWARSSAARARRGGPNLARRGSGARGRAMTTAARQDDRRLHAEGAPRPPDRAVMEPRLPTAAEPHQRDAGRGKWDTRGAIRELPRRGIASFRRRPRLPSPCRAIPSTSSAARRKSAMRRRRSPCSETRAAALPAGEARNSRWSRRTGVARRCGTGGAEWPARDASLDPLAHPGRTGLRQRVPI